MVIIFLSSLQIKINLIMDELKQAEGRIAPAKQPLHKKYSGPIIVALFVGLVSVAYFAFHKANQGLGALVKTDTVEALYITNPYGTGSMNAVLEDHYQHGIQYRVPYRYAATDSAHKPLLDSLKHQIYRDTMVTLPPKYVWTVPLAPR